MRRRQVGPSSRQERRNIARCQSCNGEGIIKGLFHEMACNQCEGAGIVDGDTGEAMEPHQLIIQLRMRLNQAAKTVRTLRGQLNKDQEDRGYGGADRGYGPNGKRYHGD